MLAREPDRSTVGPTAGHTGSQGIAGRCRRAGEHMYIDDSSSHDIHVTADGQEYDAQANYDSHHDGVTDSVMVETDYGHIEYIDSHHTGHADVLREVDSQGKVLQEAHFDASTGQWVAAGPNAADTSHTATGTMVV